MTADSDSTHSAVPTDPAVEPPVVLTLPPGGVSRRLLVASVLNWAGAVLVISAVLGGKLEAYLTRDLPTSQGGLYSTVFALTSVLGLPLAMRASHLHGPKRVLGVVCAFGILGNTITVLAQTFAVALIGHAIAGLYTAVGPLALFATRDCFPRKKFPFVLLSVLATIGLFVVVTNEVSGPLLEAIGWRGSVGCFIALTAVAMLLLKAVPNTPPRDVKLKDLDVPSRLLDATAPLLVTFGLVKGSAWGWTSPEVLGVVGAGAVLGVLLAMRARSVKRRTTALDVA
ncbi:MFS transporter [Streptomyces sp. NBC_00631]|uniref:MFS transporter n=1 Tax=Streptomyces sp. NBC_00631 TaxID=2975793 RepID=UPI0030E4DAB1